METITFPQLVDPDGTINAIKLMEQLSLIQDSIKGTEGEKYDFLYRAIVRLEMKISVELRNIEKFLEYDSPTKKKKAKK
jgi:hypothetical protein